MAAGAAGGAVGRADSGVDSGAGSAGRDSPRFTTGVRPVSSGSPLTRGAHSLSGALALVARRSERPVASADPSDGAASSEAGLDSAWAGWTKRGSSTDGSTGDSCGEAGGPAGPSAGCSPSSPVAGNEALSDPAGNERSSSSRTAGTAPVSLSGDASRASSSRCFRATTSSVGKRSARFGAGPRGSRSPVRGRRGRTRPPDPHRDGDRERIRRPARRPGQERGAVLGGKPS